MGNHAILVVAISTCFIGIITSIIAYSQMKISSAKVKHDLYERRFNVYVVALSYYQVLYLKSIEEENICKLELVRTCRELKFLFNEDDGIYEILTKIKKEGDALLLFREYRKKGRNDLDNPFKAAIEEPHDFSKSLEDLEEKIKPYIQFENVRGCNLF